MKVETSVKKVVQETPRVRLVRLSWQGAKDFAFRPGQWVGVWCDDFKGDNNKPIRRAFSIASSPGEDFVELCVARGMNFSAHLQDLKVGERVWIDGPYGMFWLKPSDKYLFVAGGTGIAPFMPMIKQALSEDKEVLLIYSIRTPSDFVYGKDLEAISHPKFKMVVTITMGGFPSWAGERGRIPVFLKKYYKSDYSAYVCGPSGLVEAVEKQLLDLGQPKEKLFVDKWE